MVVHIYDEVQRCSDILNEANVIYIYMLLL